MTNYIYPKEGISKKLFDYLCYILANENDKDLALGYLGGFEILFKEYGEKIRDEALDWAIKNAKIVKDYRSPSAVFLGPSYVLDPKSILKGKNAVELQILPEIKS